MGETHENDDEQAQLGPGSSGRFLVVGGGHSLWPAPAQAGCITGHFDAGLGNGSTFGDPGASGAHNQAGNAPALPGSAAAQADGAHEIDDPDEPN
jgi:hypothetical protein